MNQFYFPDNYASLLARPVAPAIILDTRELATVFFKHTQRCPHLEGEESRYLRDMIAWLGCEYYALRMLQEECLAIVAEADQQARTADLLSQNRRDYVASAEGWKPVAGKTRDPSADFWLDESVLVANALGALGRHVFEQLRLAKVYHNGWLNYRFKDTLAGDLVLVHMEAEAPDAPV